MTWRQMIGLGVRRVVLARGELDKLEGPKYAESGERSYAERREKLREQGIGQAAASLQDEAEESDESLPTRNSQSRS